MNQRKNMVDGLELRDESQNKLGRQPIPASSFVHRLIFVLSVESQGVTGGMNHAPAILPPAICHWSRLLISPTKPFGDGPVNKKGFADDLAAGEISPKTRIRAVHGIIAHYKIMICLHLKFMTRFQCSDQGMTAILIILVTENPGSRPHTGK